MFNELEKYKTKPELYAQSTNEFYGDIAGKEFSDTGETICGVFTK